MELFKLLLITFLVIAIIFSAIFAVLTKKTANAIISTGVISLFASILFLLLASPDVAMTEASIGAGLTTFLFFIIVHKIEKQDGKK